MTSRCQILVADDNGILLGKYLETSLRNEPGIKIDIALNPKTAFQKASSNTFDIIILDISFSEGKHEGLDVLRDIRSLNGDADIIMLSGISNADTVLKAMELGATDYVVKSSDNRFDDTLMRIRSALAQRRYKRLVISEGKTLAASVGAAIKSKAMSQVFASAIVARNAADRHVLITGPTGSGKEIVARAISRPDLNRPFVVVNCAALSDSLIESELFGYMRGAFTGAIANKVGLFEAANGGDIFLDEIGCLSPKAQAALLRVIQSGEFSRVGSTTTIKTLVRVIAATNEDLNKAVAKGNFREDLLARLRIIDISIPALRDRRDDISPIIDQTLEIASKSRIKLTDDCRAFLEAYSWPQNVRQLKATVEKMVAFASSNLLSIGDIPTEILSSLTSEKHNQLSDRTSKRSATSLGAKNLSFNIPDDLSLDRAVDLFQRLFIEHKVSRMTGPINPGTLSTALEVPRTTLIRRFRTLGIALDQLLNQNNLKKEISNDES